MAEARVNTAEFNRVFEGAGLRAVQEVEEAVLHRAAQLAPIGDKPSPTGEPHIRNSLRSRRFKSGGNWVVFIGSPLKHLRWVLEGTEPHVIHGNPLLAFTIKGSAQAIVVKSVNHPGYAGQNATGDNFLRKAVQQTLRPVIQRLDSK